MAGALNSSFAVMRLLQLVDGFADKAALGWSVDALASSVDVSGVCLDTRLLNHGDVYLAMSGASVHGMQFAETAIENGAVAVLVDRVGLTSYAATIELIKANGTPVLCVPELKQQAGAIAARFYGNPSDQMQVVAVTGTDGKTSVCRFIASALNATDHPCGYIGTLGWGLNELFETQLTTPDAVSMQRMLAELKIAGAQVIVLEASSHGLEEGRLDAVDVDVAVLTNFGRDHLDYHKTLAAYKNAKARLFSWPNLRFVVLNGQDELGSELAKNATAPRVVFFPNTSVIEPLEDQAKHSVASHSANDFSDADVRVSAESIQLKNNGLQFALVDNDQSFDQHSMLMGAFNVENLLACHGALRALGHAANDSSAALNHVAQVPGRIEQFGAAEKPTAIVDYAHTPQALSAVIGAVRHHCEGSLWVVFGCGGDRDAGKRAPMGAAAEQADKVIVTDDNPRTERSDDILQQIVAGMQKPQDALVIANRGDAIAYALTHAASNDLVLIAGKGHEDYQIIGTEKIDFSDRDIVQRFMQEAV